MDKTHQRNIETPTILISEWVRQNTRNPTCLPLAFVRMSQHCRDMTSNEFNSLNFFMGHRTKHTQQIHLCTPTAEDTEEMRIRPFHSVWNLCYSSRSWTAFRLHSTMTWLVAPLLNACCSRNFASMTTRSSTAVRKSRSGSQEIARKPPWSRVCAWATKCSICV